MSTILIVDDDQALRESLAEVLADLGHTPELAADGAQALARLARSPVDGVLLDLRMPGMDGLVVLARIRAMPNPPPVSVLTAVPTAANTIEAMRLGAFDHLAKPIGRAELASLVARMVPARPSIMAPAEQHGATLVGSSPAMRAVQKAIGMLADSDASVLITGETGTGKEVVARAIHQHGRRAKAAFVAINCAAIPAELLESQLFGHARGAFTGAVSDSLGSFRAADGGTLFLDEIGDMAPALQAKLLRVLQERVVTPVGGKPVPIDVRILSATHRDLAGEVSAGRFREDLYWRLGVVPLALPPLRERLADIVELAEHFLATVVTPPKRLSADAASQLLSHGWPGNVRELRNAMERAATLGRSAVVTGTDLGFLRPGRPPAVAEVPGTDLPGAVERLERAMIERALRDSGFVRAEAARRLGIHRQLLHEKMRRYGIETSANTTDAVRKPDGDDLVTGLKNN
jgi:two-component system NtrC family response regulator